VAHQSSASPRTIASAALKRGSRRLHTFAPMNVHHLELFYHVVKHGGISEAVRKMPYGIQQPAVSGQILQLEDDLGLKLFQRRPFSLTPAGRELFEFIEPFFGRLSETAERLRGASGQQLRLAAAATILRDYFPKMLEAHRRKFPKMRLHLHDTNQTAAEAMLRRQEIDLAITELEAKPPAGIRCAALLKLPLALLIPEYHKVRTAKQLWKRGEIADALICLAPGETLTKLFRSGLAKLGIEWPTGIEVSSLDLIGSYVSAGFGIGVSVAAPHAKPPAGTRLLALPDFPPLIVAALWQEKLPPIAEAFLDEVKRQAAQLREE
jgi:DNA-binding transcriptional LysR family regulator